MAYFKLDLLTLNTPQKGYRDVSYLASTISEFYSQVDSYMTKHPADFHTPTRDFCADNTSEDNLDEGVDFYNRETNENFCVKKECKLGDFVTNNLSSRKETYCYSYDESFSMHQNSQLELTFKLNEKIIYHDQWINNPFTHSIVNGSQILLTDKDGRQYLLTVKNIGLTFKNNNTVYSITCQDSFSYQSARQNNNYEIVNDSSSESFIGSKTLDWWADRIVADCKIAYTYLPMKQGLYLSKTGEYNTYTLDNSQFSNVIREIIKSPYTKALNPDYFEPFPFSVSGSTASAALIAAAENLGMHLITFERAYYDDSNQMYLHRYFWFEPTKNADRISGLTYTPTSSVQDFSLTLAGDELTTVLDVESNTNSNNELVTLLPEVTPFFCSLFNSKRWEKDSYYKGYFSDICKGHLFHISKNIVDATGASAEGTDKPLSLKGNLLSIEFSGYTYTLVEVGDWVGKFSNFYNKVSFSYLGQNKDDTGEYESKLEYIDDTGKATLSYANLSAWKFVIKSKNGYVAYSATDEIPSDILKRIDNGDSSIKIYIALPVKEATWSTSNTYDIYLYFFRNYTDEDLKFAKIADECPWLENKLIDLDYFLKHNIITQSQFKDINNTLSKDLRVINGQLLLYSNEYYAAIHNKTKIIAELTSQLDELGAAAQADLIDPFARLGSIQESQMFESSYKTTFKNIGAGRTPLVSFDDLITSYGNKYFNTRQRFLKNIYNFKNYFDSPNLRYSGSQVALGKLRVSTTVSGFSETVNGIITPIPKTYYWISFKEGDFYPKQVTKSFPYVSDRGVSSVPLYAKNTNNGYSLIKYVNEDNYKSYYVLNDYLTGVEPIKYDKSHPIAYNSAQSYWVSKEVEGTEVKTVLPLGPYVDEDNPTIADRYNTTELSDIYGGSRQGEYFCSEIYQRDSTNTFSLAKSNWFQFYDNLVIECGNSESWLSDKNNYNNETGWIWRMLSYTLMQDYAKQDNEYTDRLSKVAGAGSTFSESFNNVFGKTCEKDKKYTAELYAENFPVQSLYIKDGDEYKEVPFVTKANESQYYRYVTGLSKATYDVLDSDGLESFSIMYSSAITTGGCVIADADGNIYTGGINADAYVDWENQVTKSSLDTEGKSSLDIAKVQYLTHYYEGWSFDQNILWYVKDKESIGKLGRNPIKLTYDDFYSIVAPTYSSITMMPSLSSYPQTSEDFNSNIYWSAYNSNNSYYYKDEWIRPIKLDEKVNFNDTYYLLVLGSEVREEDSWEGSADANIVLNGGIINPYKEKDGSYPGISLLKDWFSKNGVQFINQKPRISKKVYYPLVNQMHSMVFNYSDKNIREIELQEVLKQEYESLSTTNLNDYVICGKTVLKTYDTQGYVRKKRYMKTIFMVFHDEPYMPLSVESPKDYYKTFKKQPFYYKDGDAKVAYADIPDLVVGLYTKKESNYTFSNLVLAGNAEFDEDGIYYDDSAKRVYTVKNLMTEPYPIKAYYRQDLVYSMDCVLDSQFDISIPINYNTTVVSEDGSVSTKTTSSQQNLKLSVKYDFATGKIEFTDKETGALSNGNSLGVKYVKDGTPYESTITLDVVTDEEAGIVKLGDLSNGAFWNMFHDKTEDGYAPLMENAAVIETQLEQYWTQAYAASKYCEYFLPEHWQPRVDKSDNYFSSSIYSAIGDKAYLSNKYLPNVKMVTVGAKSSVPSYNMVFYSDINNYYKEDNTGTKTLIDDYAEVSNDTNLALSQNNAISQFGNILYNMEGDFSKHWVLTKSGSGSYYYVENDGSGKTWNALLQDLSTKSIDFDKFSGLYVMMLQILFANYADNPLPIYNELLKRHNDCWNTLYTKYPGLFLEGTYSNEDATTSEELYNFANFYFKKMREPERNYSLTTIDVNAINGYKGQPLRIGDPIELNAFDYHDEADDIKNVLSQYLFVSDISYTLRKDSDIQLTVNDIKYQDKLIKSLAKLIR